MSATKHIGQERAQAPSAIFLSPADAGRMLGISRSAVYGLLGQGELDSVKHGKRRLITRSSVERWAQNQLWPVGLELDDD